MHKKTMAHVLALIIIFSNISIASALLSFPDLGDGHWAHPSVMELVADGTVSGFEDGHFKPKKTVSRAEFVKMIGKGTTRHLGEFGDVSAEHWGYDYIMYSGLPGRGNNFFPNDIITRDEVLNLIWTRNGSPTGVFAPSVITSQGENKDAVAWGYTYGIVRGNDSMYLRLDESLSRAEAAELIVRSRKISEDNYSYNFTEILSEDILTNFYYASALFGDEQYLPDRKITNGEMALAAMRLSSGESKPSYSGFNVLTPFEHQYAREIYVLGDLLFGEEKITVEFADKYANIRDSLAALVYAGIRQAKSPVAYGERDNYYKDVSQIEGNLFNTCITYAYKNGVHLYADGNLKPENEITVKEFTAIAMQLDYLLNFGTEITSDKRNGKAIEKGVELRKAVNTFPENYKDFRHILKNVPNEVYTIPFADNQKEALAKTSFDFATRYSFIFTDMIYEFKNAVEHGTDAKLRFSYFPSLVCENGNGGTIRVKCEVLDNSVGWTVKNIFKDKYEGELDFIPSSGSVFYADIVTGQPIVDIFVSSSNAVMKQIVFVEK